MGSADSYIGSFLSIVSKSEIRYEGVLFHIDPHESSIGLKNVRSFGTEGRKKDGPQIPSSEKVYEYIYFRGSDIKDLQVLSSPPVCSTPAIPDDPAIIQFNYLPPPPTATNLLPTGSGSVTNFTSNSQIGIPNSTFQGNQLQCQPVGNIGYRGLSHPNANGTEHAVPTYWQGFKEPTGLSHMQEQSSLRPPVGLVASPSGQQQMPYPDIHASVTSSASSFPESPSPFMPPFSTGGSINLASTLLSFSPLSQNLPIGGSTLVSNEAPHQITNNVLAVLTAGKLSSTMPLVSPLTSALDANVSIPPTSEKTKSINGSASFSQSTPSSLPLIIGMTSSNQIEASMPSLVTPSQLLQSEPTNLSSSQSSQTAQKDIEVVQTSGSESLSLDAKDDKPAVLPLPVASTKKLNDVSRVHHSSRNHLNRRMNKLNAAALYVHHGNRVNVRGDRVHLRRRGNGHHGATSHTQPGNKGHMRGAKRWINGATTYQHYSNRGHERGRVDTISSSPAKFTEDFDFVAMNEKFNKDEVWGELGKSMKSHLKDEESPNDSEGEEIEHEDAAEQLKVETNEATGCHFMQAVYVKDDFFDSLSCNSSFNCESKKGRLRFSEQRKLDTETFGDFQTKRSGRGSWGRGRGCGWLQVSKLGSANGQVGRGRGRGRGRGDAVWSRVT